MDAGTLSIKTIFGQDRRHIVPLFQRPYVWTREDQWSPLWDDLCTVSERLLNRQQTRPHFLGAIVLDSVRKPTGHLEARLVIDGQQRLTTMQLLLVAFRDVCAAHQAERHHKALSKLTQNDDPLSDDPDDVFKVWPTNVDRLHFRNVMTAGGPENLCKAYGLTQAGSALNHPIPDAYLFFHERVADWLHPGEPDFENRLETLYSAVREYLRMVVIDLEEDDDPQLIFETLNARGTPLLPSDLVKNHLFHRAQMEGQDLEPLYERYWRPFDDLAIYWREELGRGHARRARIDTFLAHYLTLRKRDEVAAGHLYAAFRDLVADGAVRTPEEHLRSLRQYAEVFRSLDNMEAGSRERLFFDRLADLDITSAYPFLMELFVQVTDPAERLAILLDLESFLVRRMVCQLNTRGYNRLFIDALLRLAEPAGSPSSRVREFLLSSQADSSRWPSDDELRQSWLEEPLYKSLLRSRVRMLLEALERELYDGRSEQVQFGEKLTIEHLLPQEWRPHWPLPGDVDPGLAIAERERLLQTMGNLTLLTRKLNPSLSNGPWTGKLPAILLHSALGLNRRLQGIDGWDEAAIRQRGQGLVELACRVWPIPERAEVAS